MRTDFEKAYVTAHGSIAVVTMNDPGVMNAVGLEMLGGLSDAIDHVQDKANRFRALILTGEGRGFCSGANLSSGMAGKRLDAGAALETAYHPFLRKLRNLDMPFITAVNGAAAGVGMSFALISFRPSHASAWCPMAARPGSCRG
jgi:2-(1,2-epoxy-1,2-dihydrophenyl)acetyl-CoA isomerase